MKELIENEFKAAKMVFDLFNKHQNFSLIETAAKLMISSINSGNKIMSIGNGGSMSDSTHFASELSGRFRQTRPALPAIAFSDASALTCVSNDFGYPLLFKRQIEAIGKENDVLLCLSTSGNSENILVAAEYAKMKGIKVISICGKHGKLREYSDVVIEIPHEGTADRIQEMTILIIHILVTLIEKTLYP